MNRKGKLILSAFVVLVLIIGGLFWYQQSQQEKGDKAIAITIQVDDKKIYEEEVQTDTVTLGALLEEMQEEKDIVLKFKDEGYGMYITAMGKDKLYHEDAAASKYWTYSSSNNKQCVKAGFCDAASLLNIKDGDAFVFTLAVLTY